MSIRFTRAALAAITALSLTASPILAAGDQDDGHDEDGHHGVNGHHADAIGKPGDPDKADRVVEVRMGEMYFKPGEISVKKGATILFKVTNDGEVVHEFNIGTPGMHEAHADEMMEMMERGFVMVDHIDHARMRSAGMMHDDPNSLLLEPGQSGELAWTFSEEVELQMSCNVPGHREGGMLAHIHMGH